MTIKGGMCNLYKADILRGIHSLEDEYRIALYAKDAEITPATSEYTPEGEVTGSGYEAGGVTLSNARVSLNGAMAQLNFDSVEWRMVSFIAHGCMVYNASKANRAVAIFDFGEDIEARNGNFEIELPQGNLSLIRIG